MWKPRLKELQLPGATSHGLEWVNKTYTACQSTILTSLFRRLHLTIKETLFLALAQRKIKVHRSPNIENQTEKPCSNDGVCSMKLLTLKLLDHCSGKPFIYSLISVH